MRWSLNVGPNLRNLQRYPRWGIVVFSFSEISTRVILFLQVPDDIIEHMMRLEQPYCSIYSNPSLVPS